MIGNLSGSCPEIRHQRGKAARRDAWSGMRRIAKGVRPDQREHDAAACPSGRRMAARRYPPVRSAAVCGCLGYGTRPESGL